MQQKLYVRKDIGTGKPLVLLHGMFADGSQWEKISKLLSNDFRVIVVDLLGHGRSPRPPDATYSDVEHVASLRITLESLNATNDATIVGYSMGGSVALAYSANYPDSVEQLYLISSPFYLKPDQMMPNKYAGSILFTKASTGLFHLLENLMQAEGRFDKIIKFGNRSKKFHSMIGANDNELETAIIRKNLNQLVREFDFVGHLKKLNVPLTFFAGKKDLFIVQSQLNALRQYHPYMDIQRLEVIKVDHMLVQNLPKEIAKLLLKNSNDSLSIRVDKGTGNPLVLIHGIESSSGYWTNIIEPLSENHRVIAIDLLGFGNSPQPLNIAYTLDDQVHWLERTLDKYGIKSFDILAHSLGSLVALKFAAQNPSRVKSMTFFAPVFVPDENESSNYIIKRLNYMDNLADGSFLQSHAAQALGYRRLNKYLPFVRTVQNSVRLQKANEIAKQAKNIPLNIVYGERDGLIDKKFLTEVSNIFKNTSVKRLKKLGHNFSLFEPDMALRYGFPKEKYKKAPIKSEILPPTFAKQLVKLAAPVLIANSFIYTAAGILIFTTFAPWIITIGLAFFVVRLGYGYIQGAFTLKNENLSYLGYVLLGMFGIFIGYSLIKNPEAALRISSIILSGLVLFAGLARLIVAVAWTDKKLLRRSLLITGALMTIVGALAINGGIISTKIIVYGLAIFLLVQGIQFGIFASVAVVFAYMRGFNTTHNT